MEIVGNSELYLESETVEEFGRKSWSKVEVVNRERFYKIEIWLLVLNIYLSRS